jgi:hypothetical protein
MHKRNVSVLNSALSSLLSSLNYYSINNLVVLFFLNNITPVMSLLKYVKIQDSPLSNNSLAFSMEYVYL